MLKIIFFIVVIAGGMLIFTDLLGIKPAKASHAPAIKEMGPGCEGIMILASIVLIALFVIIGLVYY